MRTHLILTICLLVGIAPAQESKVIPTVTTLQIEEGTVTPLHLSPGYTTSVRLPEDISSVVIGNPRWACRRFVRGMGIRTRRPYRNWSEQEQQRLLKLIDLHPVNEIAKLMRRSQSSIWHMLQRLGANAKMGKDNFTVYTLAEALHVRPDKIQEWISRGWLKARQVETGKAVRVIIEAEAFCEFCRKHTRDVVGNRLTEERLDFVYHFVFPPSHAALLPVRESKKERNAYGAQLEEAGNQRFGPDNSGEGREVFDRIA